MAVKLMIFFKVFCGFKKENWIVSEKSKSFVAVMT